MPEEPSTVDGQPPRQARSNGLPAPAWVPLRDIDPRFATPLLETLRGFAVPAYVAPASGRAGFALEVRLPARPTDRLWVDARLRTEAERIVAQALPGLEAGLHDDDWDAIVAMFNAGSDEPGTWPAVEDVRRSDDPDDIPRSTLGRSLDPYDDEDHFIPPDPPPAPPARPATKYGWALLLGGLLVLIVPTLFGQPVGSAWSYIAIACVAGGFATLVYQMKDSPPTDSGPDDGAVV